MTAENGPGTSSAKKTTRIEKWRYDDNQEKRQNISRAAKGNQKRQEYDKRL